MVYENEDFRERQTDFSILSEDCGNNSSESGSCLVYVKAIIEHVLWETRGKIHSLKDSSGCQRHRKIFDCGKLSLFYSNVSANMTSTYVVLNTSRRP